MNEENEGEPRVTLVDQDVANVNKAKARRALKKMKIGEAVAPNPSRLYILKYLGESLELRTLNKILERERMFEEWKRSVLVPIFKNKRNVQSCGNYRGIKLMNRTMKLWERVVEARLRTKVSVCEQQYGFMPKKSTTDAIFSQRMLIEKYREGQMELHCVFVDLQTADDKEPRKKL